MMVSISAGIQQGSILRPSFLLVYANDLQDYRQHIYFSAAQSHLSFLTKFNEGLSGYTSGNFNLIKLNLF